MKLPHELQCLILYRYGGLEHPTARIMKPLIKEMREELVDCEDETEFAHMFSVCLDYDIAILRVGNNWLMSHIWKRAAIEHRRVHVIKDFLVDVFVWEDWWLRQLATAPTIYESVRMLQSMLTFHSDEIPEYERKYILKQYCAELHQTFPDWPLS